MDMIIGICIGAAFAPFWTWIWNNYIKKPVTSAVEMAKDKIEK